MSAFIQLILLKVALAAVERKFVKIDWNYVEKGTQEALNFGFRSPMIDELGMVHNEKGNNCGGEGCYQVNFEQTFSRLKTEKYCKGKFFFHCDCNHFNKPSYLHFLCFMFKNPVFLGKFYNSLTQIDKFNSIKTFISEKCKNYYYLPVFKKSLNKMNNFHNFKFGSQILGYAKLKEDIFFSVSPLLSKVPLKVFSGSCTLKPVKYRVNYLGYCISQFIHNSCEQIISPETANNLTTINLQFASDELPIILKNLNSLKGIKNKIVFKCITLKLLKRKFLTSELNIFQNDVITPCDNNYSWFDAHKIKYYCSITYIYYQFSTNGSELLKFNVEYGLSKISNEEFNSYKSDKVKKNLFYFQKYFKVKFEDISDSKKKDQNFFEKKQSAKRGYFVGEKLNVGDKKSVNSTTFWEKGFIGLFKNGHLCDDIIPLTFGFDSFSSCVIQKNFSDCHQLKDIMEEKFENIIKGNYLSSYGHFRHFAEGSIPIIKNYLNFSGIQLNSSKCHVPHRLDIFIRHEISGSKYESSAHRILGIKADYHFLNVSLRTKNFRLMSRAVFILVSTSKVNYRTSFWKKVYSSEKSENAWFNILNLLSDMNSQEEEEALFWGLLLILIVLPAITRKLLVPDQALVFL